MCEEANRMDSPQSQQQENMHSNGISSSIAITEGQTAENMPEKINRLDSAGPQQQEIANNDMSPSWLEESKKLKKRFEDFRAWLFFLTTLVATISYTAGLTPPGGFWSTDDKEKGYAAGTSVMRAMFTRRYQAFYYSNATAFFSSLMIIGCLGKIGKRSVARKALLQGLVGICFVSVGISFISGTWESTAQGIYGIVLFVVVILYFSLLVFSSYQQQRYRRQKQIAI